MNKKNDADASDIYPKPAPPSDGKYGSSSTDSDGKKVTTPPTSTDQV